VSVVANLTVITHIPMFLTAAGVT